MPATLAKKTSSISGKKNTKARAAPDFKKLHQQFQQKFEKGKACTKKPCTIVQEFDFSKVGVKTEYASIKTPNNNRKTNNCDKENCSPFGNFSTKKLAKDFEFTSDSNALKSILNNTGITVQTQQSKPTRQTFACDGINTPPQNSQRRETAVTENVRRSIYYAGNNVKPSPTRVFSEYCRHVLSLSQRNVLAHKDKDNNGLGASPQLQEKGTTSGVSPFVQGKTMSLCKRLYGPDTPNKQVDAKRLTTDASSVKAKRVFSAKSPAPASPSFKIPMSVPRSAKKQGIKWKDLLGPRDSPSKTMGDLNGDMVRLEELEKLEKELESDIEVMETKPKTKKIKAAPERNARSPLVSRNRNTASPRGQRAKSTVDAFRNISPIRTPGQVASPRRLPPKSPLVGNHHAGSPKRKAEAVSKLSAGMDASCTPPRNKRPVRENDITPKGSTKRAPSVKGQSPFGKDLKGQSPARAILGELATSVCRASPTHLQFTEYEEDNKENFSPEMLKEEVRGDDSFFLVDEDEDDQQDEVQEEEDMDELNRTLNQSIAQMEDLEAQANKARRRTDDPEKLMEQLQLIQKKQQELMQMQNELQNKLKNARTRKNNSENTSNGPLRAKHAPTPSKRWRAEYSEDDSSQGSQIQKDSSESTTNEPKSSSSDAKNVTPLRKVLFPLSQNLEASAKKEVHFRESIEVCEIAATDVSSLSPEIESDAVALDGNVFESPVEVRIYGQRGEIDPVWKTQSSITMNNKAPIVTVASSTSQTQEKSSARFGSLLSYKSTTTTLPVLSPLQIEIPSGDCGYPRSDSLLDVIREKDGTTSTHGSITTNTTTFSSLTTPTKSPSYIHSPRTPSSTLSRLQYTTSSPLSPSSLTMSPLTISPKNIMHTGSLSLSGNLSNCRSPFQKSRGLLDQCLLAQAQIRYEEALADDEVSRYMNRLSAMPRGISPSYRCREPLSKILDEGDDKHFVPICKPLEEISKESSFYPIVCPIPRC